MKSFDRKKNYGEVYTPITLVEEILNELPDEVWEDKSKIFLDPTCGNGNFLVGIKKRGIPIENIYGVDILEDNCRETIVRLYSNIEPNENGFKEETEKIKRLDVNKDREKIEEFFGKNWFKPGLLAVFLYNNKPVKNIVQADGLIYDYSFGEISEENNEKDIFEEFFYFK